MKNTKNEVVVVTGGSRGIGAAISRLAAHKGWKVCVNYKNNESIMKSWSIYFKG